MGNSSFPELMGDGYTLSTQLVAKELVKRSQVRDLCNAHNPYYIAEAMPTGALDKHVCQAYADVLVTRILPANATLLWLVI